MTIAVQTNDGEAYELYKELVDRGDLPIRVFLTIYYDDVGKEGTPSPNHSDDFYGGLLSSRRLKLLSDGSLGASTASLSESYCNCSHRGMLIYSQEELIKRVQVAHDLGSLITKKKKKVI